MRRQNRNGHIRTRSSPSDKGSDRKTVLYRRLSVASTNVAKNNEQAPAPLKATLGAASEPISNKRGARINVINHIREFWRIPTDVEAVVNRGARKSPLQPLTGAALRGGVRRSALMKKGLKPTRPRRCRRASPVRRSALMKKGLKRQ